MKLVDRKLMDRGDNLQTCVVDENVDPWVYLVDRIQIGQVAGERRTADFIGDLRCGVGVEIKYRDVRAGGGESHSGGLADPRASTRDERSAAVQVDA